MPEGHTIHRLAARHRELFAGRRVTVLSPQGRFAAGAAALSGSVLVDTEAYGKHLFHHYRSPHGLSPHGLSPDRLSPDRASHDRASQDRASHDRADRSIHIHLGLYGRFTDGVPPVPDPVGQIRLRVVGRRHWLDLRGPTACEVLDPSGVAGIRARLGPDPLRDDADPGPAYLRIQRSGTGLLSLLMDQSIIAGPGLIYATEVLFRAGIPPTRLGRDLSPEAWRQLWQDLRALMKEGVARGRIDTVHTQHTPEAMRRAPRVDRHGGEVYVYRRAGLPCLVCGTEIRRGTLSGRNSYWCPRCQR